MLTLSLCYGSADNYNDDLSIQIGNDGSGGGGEEYSLSIDCL